MTKNCCATEFRTNLKHPRRPKTDHKWLNSISAGWPTNGSNLRDTPPRWLRANKTTAATSALIWFINANSEELRPPRHWWQFSIWSRLPFSAVKGAFNHSARERAAWKHSIKVNVWMMIDWRFREQNFSAAAHVAVVITHPRQCSVDLIAFRMICNAECLDFYSGVFYDSAWREQTQWAKEHKEELLLPLRIRKIKEFALSTRSFRIISILANELHAKLFHESPWHPASLRRAAQDLREVINYFELFNGHFVSLVWLRATAKAPAHDVCLLARWDESTGCDTWQDGVKGRWQMVILMT